MEGNKATLLVGKLHAKYEVFSQLFTEFGCDEDGYSEDSNNDLYQGECIVFIHSNVRSLPDQVLFRKRVKEILEKDKINRLLVFSNSPLWGDLGSFGHYRASIRGLDVDCIPQHIEDIGFNILTTTNTYMRFKEKIAVWGGKIWRNENEVYILPSDGGKKKRWK